MRPSLSLIDLMEYTEWERQKWHAWLRQRGGDALKTSAGPHGDGRMNTVGDVVKHVFSAERRFVDRLSGRPLTDVACLPNDDVEALFQFGERSRKDLREYVDKFPVEEWDVPQDHKMLNQILTATPKKVIAHIVMHEIRHWAQIATMLRMNGLTDDFHDFLFSPVLGGGLRPDNDKA